MTDKIVVNFYGAPGAGKTTAAASLFSSLKKLHIDCELVAEYPKDLVLEDNKKALANQCYVFAGQLHRLQCAYDATRVAILDSPLLLSAIYNPNTSKHLTDLVFEQYGKFNNVNVLVRRDPSYPYSLSGRIHSMTESVSIENQIITLLEQHNIPYVPYDDYLTEDRLIDFIREEINV